MKIQLSDHFTYGRLFRFTLPSIVMMVFTSIYGVVDGFFVCLIVVFFFSYFLEDLAFGSVNLARLLFLAFGVRAMRKRQTNIFQC